jgi:ASC-1-like (ASCH) protein
VKKIDERMDKSEKQAIARGQKIAFAERLFWRCYQAQLVLRSFI